MMQDAPHKLYYGFTLTFWRLCGCNLLFFASFNMMIPELPGYLRSMGGEEYVGLIIALFTVTALISRPFSGKWADNIGRVPVIIIGALVSAFCGFLYIFTTTVFAFLTLRLIHGFSTGFTPTGTSAYVADLVTNTKRGAAMGLLSLAGSVGMAMGPIFGSWLVMDFGYDTLFLWSGLSGLAAVAWMAGMRETLAHKKKFKLNMFRVRFHEFYEPQVFAPALVLFLAVLSFGTMLTLIPFRCEVLGLENKGVFFTVFTVASVFVRFSAGKISDNIGREKVLVVSTSLVALSMIVLGTAQSIPILLLGSAIFGLGSGINSPTVMAWAVDLSVDKHIGRAMATVYMALELGIGGGALLSGTLFGISHDLFTPIFLGCSFFCLLALAYLIARINKKGQLS